MVTMTKQKPTFENKLSLGLNKIIFSGESLISSAFNRVAEPYSNYINEQDTRERIILLIAKDIKRQLILFKNKKKYNEG